MSLFQWIMIFFALVVSFMLGYSLSNNTFNEDPKSNLNTIKHSAHKTLQILRLMNMVKQLIYKYCPDVTDLEINELLKETEYKELKND